MQDKPDSLHTLGLDITSSSLRGVQVSLRKGKPFVERIYEIPIASKSTEGGASSHALTQDDRQFREASRKNLIVVTLPTNATLVRQLEIKLKKVGDIDAVLPFHAEPLLPYSIENGCLDRIIVNDTAEGKLLTIVAVRKDHLKQQLDLCHSLEVEPEIVTATAEALAALATHFGPPEQLQGVIHLGETETVCILVRQGKLLAAQVCAMGFENLIVAATENHAETKKEQFNSINFSELHRENSPHTSEALDQLRMEIARTFYSLSKLSKGQEIQQVLVMGGGAQNPTLLAAIFQSIGKPYTILKIDSNSVDPSLNLDANKLQKFAIPLGAALLGLPNGETINFRQGEFAYPYPWKRYKEPLITYLALCLGLAGALFFAGSSYIHQQEDGLRKEYAELLASTHKPYNEFEKSFLKKNRSDVETVPSIQQLSKQDIANRLQFLQKEIQSAPEHYPLLPHIPTVSDMLAWLATHPNVVERDPKTELLSPLLQLESLSYTLLKRPEMTKKQEKYQVKVELEFSSETPKAAREFHDALIAPNAMVDPKGEVKWSTNRGLYRASFFLKDKTVYPTAS